jgi:hypothetical protein
MDVSPINQTQEDTLLETPGTDDTMQPKIGIEEEGQFMEEDVVDEDEKELLEDDLRRLQKVDSVSTINALRMKPEKTFRLSIPLCRLVAMPMVHPTLSCDIQLLEQEFACGYRDGATVFYVSTTNEAGESAVFTMQEMDDWDPLWKQ